VTDADRRLAALAATLARERAGALLARLGAPGASEAAAHARTLGEAPRSERLRALADALAQAGPGEPVERGAAAVAERPRVAAILGAVRSGVARPGASGILVRLCRERLGPF
jgi:hypothetical protein